MKHFILDIASIKVRCDFTYPLPKMAQAKYANFIAADGHYDHRLHLHYNIDSIPRANQDAAYLIKGNKIHFYRNDFIGSLDLTSHEGDIYMFPSLFTMESLLRLVYSSLLNLDHGFIIHSSSIKHDNKGYLFSGASGSGKSTIARLIGATILSDELVAVREVAGRFLVFGTPFLSKFVFGGHNESAPLAGFYLLNKADHNRKIPLSPLQTLTRLLPNIFFVSSDKGLHHKLLHTAERFVKSTASYELYFKKDASVRETVF